MLSSREAEQPTAGGLCDRWGALSTTMLAARRLKQNDTPLVYVRVVPWCPTLRVAVSYRFAVPTAKMGLRFRIVSDPLEEET